MITRSFANRLSCSCLLQVVMACAVTSVAWCDDWPQSAGANNNFVVRGNAPAAFSVSRNENILWRTSLPNTGQGSVILSGKRAFVLSHAPITGDAQTGSLTVGQCFNANTGKELWRRDIPGVRITDFSSLFSDNTAASPVTDGLHVCFINVGGSIHTFDFKGNEVWSYRWTPFGRHHSRQHEPFVYAGQLLVMQTPRTDLPETATTKAGAKPLGRNKEVWTHLQAFDLATGKRSWIAEAGTSVHSTSLLGSLASGEAAILTGRGGGHQPPEEPYGVSLISADTGKSIWTTAVKGYPAAQNACWNSEVACLFSGTDHLTLDIQTGAVKHRNSVTENVSICIKEQDRYIRKINQNLTGYKKAITYQTNVLVGDYHYFLAHHTFMIGRVNIKTGNVEYLQVPAQIIRKQDQPDVIRWDATLPNDMKNADGYLATQDKRNTGSGWGHVSAATPIVVGQQIYFPTMVGMVYVLRWDAKILDQEALLSVSDLGPAGKTWSLSGLSFANNRLYARTLKELICIGKKR